MKMTDLAILFVVIILPMIVIVYVNTSFVIKAEKEEIYYKTIIDTAIDDATKAMKEIENTNLEIDYGYSGIVDNKVSINAKAAIDTFYNSLFNNFGIKGNELSEDELKSYIPVIAVMDYDGVYIHSAEEDMSGNIIYTTKPKKYYLYSFGIKKTLGDNYEIEEDLRSTLVDNLIFQVVFTMDDYIYLNVFDKTNLVDPYQYKFYLTDAEERNKFTYHFSSIPSDQIDDVKQTIVNRLEDIREQKIIDVIQEALSSTVNKHNDYARQLNIKYEFIFSKIDEKTWYENIDGIGMIAVIQGISLGNRYLDYNAYSTSTLLTSKKYYLANEIFKGDTENSDKNKQTYLSDKLYHISENCPIYQEYIFRWKNEYWELTPKFLYKRTEAAANGFLPCPICKP